MYFLPYFLKIRYYKIHFYVIYEVTVSLYKINLRKVLRREGEKYVSKI